MTLTENKIQELLESSIKRAGIRPVDESYTIAGTFSGAAIASILISMGLVSMPAILPVFYGSMIVGAVAGFVYDAKPVNESVNLKRNYEDIGIKIRKNVEARDKVILRLSKKQIEENLAKAEIEKLTKMQMQLGKDFERILNRDDPKWRQDRNSSLFVSTLIRGKLTKIK